jgi:pimeloyl-ACP methyl ester carboxylesterase
MIAWLTLVLVLSIMHLVSRDHGRTTPLTWISLLLIALLVFAAGAYYVRESRPARPKPEDPDNKDRTAILVVHGMGYQDRYQMLDDFARSMPVYTQAHAGRVNLLDGSPKNQYLPLHVVDKQVDVHEAFWGHLFNRLVKLPATILFAVSTLFKFAPGLFSRFWRKRLAEAVYVGFALAVLYVAISSLYSGLVIASQRFEAEEVRFEKGGGQPSALAAGVSKNPARMPTWQQRIDITWDFVKRSVGRGLSAGAWSEAISIEKPKELLLRADRTKLVLSLIYCICFGLIALSILRLLVAQAKYWSAGARGPKDNIIYEEAVNEKWTRDSWGAIKGGIGPLAVLLMLDPVLPLVFTHLVATIAILVLVLKGLAWWTTNFLGDVMIYATLNANAETFEAREKATDLIADRLRCLLDRDEYSRVVVVAHSLGSVIAANAVRRVFNGGHEQFAKLGAFVTIGSPLRKFRQLFKAKPYLWSFGDNAISRDSDIFIGEEYEHKGRVPWFNYWYGSDLFADRLAYEPIGKLKQTLANAAQQQDQAQYSTTVVETFKTRYDEFDTTGFRVGDRRDCNLGPRFVLWSHSDYWLDHRFVDDLLVMARCDEQTIKTMSVALKPTLAANIKTSMPCQLP